MKNRKQAQVDYAQLAELLDYPGEHTWATADRILQDAALSRKSGSYLQEFVAQTASLGLAEMQELYTRTFDLSPLCSPALSVHLFGTESYKRSHLMVGLLSQYRAANFLPQSEMADHMATIMRYLSIASAPERHEIIHYIVKPGFEIMAGFLESKSNPYGQLLRAIVGVVAEEPAQETAHA